MDKYKLEPMAVAPGSFQLMDLRAGKHINYNTGTVEYLGAVIAIVSATDEVIARLDRELNSRARSGSIKNPNKGRASAENGKQGGRPRTVNFFKCRLCGPKSENYTTEALRNWHEINDYHHRCDYLPEFNPL